MDFRDTPEEASFRKEVRAWFQANLPEGWGSTSLYMESPDKRIEFLRDFQRKLYEGGLSLIHI